MSEGYKLTELGDIPESWEVTTIEQVAEVKGGKRLPKGKELQVRKSRHPYIRVADMFMGGISLSNILYVPDDVFPSISNYTISKDDLFISVAGTLGIVGTVPEVLDGANLTENANKITNIKIDKSFLFHIMSSTIIQDVIAKEKTNNAQPKLALTRIRLFSIPIPPRVEQQKIASILSTVDEKIAIIDEQISQTQELKKGLMQQLLSKGIGHTKFKSSELGDIPESWEVVRLDSHIQLLSGFAFQSGKFNEEGRGTRLLRGINITVGKLRFNDKIDKYWNEPFQEFEKYALNAGDLVISMDGSLVGKNYAKVEEEYLPLLLVQRVARIRTNPSLSSEFLHQIIGSPSFLKYSDSVKTSSAIPHISAKNIKDFKIPFPTRLEQDKISSILSAVDEKLQSLDNRKETYQQLKNGLMQQLLTGKIRVTTSQNEPALA